MKRTYRSEAAAAVHEAANDLHELGLMSKERMDRFDEMCLTPVPAYEAADVKALRERENVSRRVMARYLNVAPDLIGEWEEGVKRPSGAARKLLSLIESKGLSALL